MPKILKILLYPLIFFVATLAFVVVLFPYDSVKMRVAREIEKAMGGAYQISIGTLSPDFPSGALLKDVEMKSRGGEASRSLKLNSANLKFALLPLLSGTMEVDFDLRPPQGRASGSYAFKKGGIFLNLKADRFDLGLVSFLTKDAGIPVGGQVSGDVALELYTQDPLKNTGKINLQVLELALGEISLGDGTFKVPAMKLAATGAGSRVDAAINRGNFEVKALTLTGGDLVLDTNGKIYGARKADNYRFNLKGTFKVSQEFADKIQILALVDKQKQADGTYPFTITGRVMKPNIRIGDFKLPL